MTHSGDNQRVLLIGTRGSTLASTQAGHVRDGVLDSGARAELHFVHTPGDASQKAQTPVANIGVGVFTETLRTALANGECDIAVHSFKDLPTAPDTRFRTVVPERVDPREVLISVDNQSLQELPSGAKVGTSAPRRVSQLKAVRSDLEILPLRGNVGTRMSRVGQDLDAVILARAGLERIGELDRAAESIDPQLIKPAPAQGALSVEVRADDEEAWNAVKHLDHVPSHARAVAERAVLSTLEAGCTAPVAAYSTLEEDSEGQHTLTLTGGAYALDGSRRVEETITVPIDLRERWHSDAESAGRSVGRALLTAGAADIMA